MTPGLLKLKINCPTNQRKLKHIANCYFNAGVIMCVALTHDDVVLFRDVHAFENN